MLGFMFLICQWKTAAGRVRHLTNATDSPCFKHLHHVEIVPQTTILLAAFVPALRRGGGGERSLLAFSLWFLSRGPQARG